MSNELTISFRWRLIRITVDAAIAAERYPLLQPGDEINIGIALILLEAQWRKDHPEHC